MKDLITRRMIAATIPLVFVLVLLGAAFRDRVLDPVVSGGLIAILGAIVALFAGQSDKDKDEEKKGKG
jgi:di/tricarboxylate transporter